MSFGTRIALTAHTFPHRVQHRDVTGHIMLYAEKTRKRVTFRFYGPDGGRSEKDAVPLALGEAGSWAEAAVVTKDEQGREEQVIYVAELVIRWAQRYLEQKADERRGIARDIAAAKNGKNHVRIGYLFERVRDSEWYRDLGVENRRRLTEVDLPMRWVESALGSGFMLSRWDANTLKLLERARCTDGINTTTVNGDRTFLVPCGKNTFVRDIGILNQIFKEACGLLYHPTSNAFLLDVNPMDRLERKRPKAGVRRKREVIDEHRYHLLLSVADEVDPTGRFKFLLILLRWTGRRVSTALRLTRGVLLFTEEEIRTALERQLCVYVLPHDIGRTACLYAKNGMAMYVRWWMVKGGRRGEAGRSEQYDAVHPVHPLVAVAARNYLDSFWNRLRVGQEEDVHGLGPDSPLFPSGQVITKSMSKGQVYEWFRKAARLLGDRQTPLRMTIDNAFHGLRYNRRTELYGVSAKYARWLGEHSVLSGTPGITVSEGVYQGLVPPELVRVARTEAPKWEDAWKAA